MRARTTLLTSTMKQRRANVLSPRTAACSKAAVNRPATRARMMARDASASVKADVTFRPSALSAANADGSCSSRAASNALDSMYRRLSTAIGTRGTWEAGLRTGRRRCRLRFATIAVDQVRGGATRQADIRPVLQGVASFDGWTNHPSRHEFVEPALPRGSRAGPRRNELRDNAAVRRHRNPLAGLDSADVPAQVVPQVPDPGLHDLNIATCGHICKIAVPVPSRMPNRVAAWQA